MNCPICNTPTRDYGRKFGHCDNCVIWYDSTGTLYDPDLRNVRDLDIMVDDRVLYEGHVYRVASISESLDDYPLLTLEGSYGSTIAIRPHYIHVLIAE